MQCSVKMKPFIKNCLKEFVEKRVDIFGSKCKFVDFELNRVRADIQGFQSDKIVGRIRYVDKNGDIMISPSLFLKFTPAKSNISEAVFLQFANEIFFYSHILPFFAQLESSVLEHFAKFYISFTRTCPQSHESVIILENLWDAQYKNAPCKSFLDYSHLSVMVRSLGRFHACSYLAKELDPSHFQAHAFPLNPIHLFLIGKSPGFLTKLGNRGLERLAQQSEYQSLIPGIRQLLDNADQIMINLFRNERYNPWAVVCHGDYTSGNVMFKYEKDQPIGIKMFDLAMSTYSTPVLDLALLFYMNASQETRDLHWDQLIDDYCHGLSSLPLPITHLPTRDDIKKEFHSKAFHTYLLVSSFLPFLISDDLKLDALDKFSPSDYADGDSVMNLPIEVSIDVLLVLGGEAATEAVANVLKDMIKRGFI